MQVVFVGDSGALAAARKTGAFAQFRVDVAATRRYLFYLEAVARHPQCKGVDLGGGAWERAVAQLRAAEAAVGGSVAAAGGLAAAIEERLRQPRTWTKLSRRNPS